MANTLIGSVKNLLMIAASGEAATGFILLMYPPIVIWVLFGVEIAGAEIIVSRIAGIALIGLGLACWPRSDATRDNARALLGMLSYSVMATLYLGYVALVVRSSGTGLWPAIFLHAVLTILLTWAWFKK